MKSLTGALLLAHPGLGDPNFSRTVIFLAAHDEEQGAFGVVLNRELDRPLSELMPETELGALEDCPIFVGGPVSTNQLSFMEIAWDEAMGAVRFAGNLNLDEAREMMLLRPDGLRAVVGYSGWAGGQLEAELKSGSWIVQAPVPGLFEKAGEQMWRSLLALHGSHLTLLAGEPDDPSLN